MATLVLTAVGAALGGPIGAALGGLAGQKIDQSLFAPRAAEGGRLAQLAVQGSAYGADIPKIFGTMRVAGNLIWATDLQEQRQSQSQGKGRPKRVSYSYRASFAVALSARPGTRIGRIWADGKLLRGAAGDFKVVTGFRFYAGHEDQQPDPLIVAAEGGTAPAYRGICYAVFEDMALESFGNRIPFLSFELVAEANLTLEQVIEELGGGALTAACPAPIIGFAALGGSTRSTLAPLLELRGLDLVDKAHGARGEGQMAVARAQGAGMAVPPPLLGARSGPGAQNVPMMTRAVRGRSRQISLFQLGYADPDRDYQLSTQRAELFMPGQSAVRDLPVALDAATARRWALEALLDARAEAEDVRISVPWSLLDLQLGAVLTLADLSGLWRVSALSFETMQVTARLRRLASAPDMALRADAGRGVLAADQAHGPTRLVLAELPAWEAGVAARPLLVAAAAGHLPGWRRAALAQSGDQGGHWTELGSTPAPAILGTAASLLGPVNPHLPDRGAPLIVDLLHKEMALVSVTEDALLAGENLMMVGRELIQFGRAEQIGPARYSLSRLLRGRRGTEPEMARHQLGEDVVLLDRAALVPLDLAAGATRWSVMATGIGDAAPVIATASIIGLATRPLMPVHQQALRTADGGVMLRWIRRSRDGWDWLDRVDAPLAEERERYRLTLIPDMGAAEVEEVDAPVLRIAGDRLAAWRRAGSRQLDWRVAQLGTAGTSPEATARLLL